MASQQKFKRLKSPSLGYVIPFQEDEILLTGESPSANNRELVLRLFAVPSSSSGPERSVSADIATCSLPDLYGLAQLSSKLSNFVNPENRGAAKRN